MGQQVLFIEYVVWCIIDQPSVATSWYTLFTDRYSLLAVSKIKDFFHAPGVISLIDCYIARDISYMHYIQNLDAYFLKLVHPT